jgi:photosystem II stability/assembly factor-like uncharacterized protein
MLISIFLFLLMPICSVQDNYWVKLNFPSNISVSSLAISDLNIIFAGTFEKGVYISTDKGATWQESNNGLKCLDVRTFAIQEDGNIYAGTTKGLYKSTDLGRSWIFSGFQDKYIADIEINSKGHLYICGPYLPVLYSTDNGQNWQNPIKGLEEISYVYSLAIKSDSIIFAGATTNDTDPVAGIFRSTDYGRTWKRACKGLTNQEINCVVISLSGIIYACAGQVYQKSGVFLSKDNGDNWKQVIEMDCGDCYPLTLYANFTHTVFFGMMGGGISFSDDGGNKWKDLNGSQIIRVVHSIIKDSDNFIYISTHDDGVYRSVRPYKEK